ARTASDVERIQKSGKIASLIGVEGGHCIEDSIENLRRLHKLGAGYMTLTHSDTLAWADAATDEEKHGGLTEFGEEVVREMNRLGMLIDLSHVSAETMKDALRITKAPVIFSHSSARAVADHPRNVPDDVLLLTRENGGVVMVNFFSGFVHPDSARKRANMFQVNRELREKYPNESEYKIARQRWDLENPIQRGSLHDVVDHIDHIVKVAGIDHVGIGSDYDGITLLPEQLDDVSTYPLITQEMLNRGYSASQIHQVMSGNILRVMRKAETVAAKTP
ncbi:dipeptidase, partial [Schlesneria sp.]|uniref:dipeptidase n=1 Tax=Schlesneria sp. TaxID=2762018 RepID=UPI002EFDA5BF